MKGRKWSKVFLKLLDLGQELFQRDAACKRDDFYGVHMIASTISRLKALKNIERAPKCFKLEYNMLVLTGGASLVLHGLDDFRN